MFRSSKGGGGGGGGGGRGKPKRGPDGKFVAPPKGLTNPPPVHMGKQGKHIVGHNNYIPGKSILKADPEKLRKFAGTGHSLRKTPVPQPGSRELVDFGEIIGDHVDEVSGVATPTQWGVITYAKDCLHIFPVRPQVSRP